VYSRNGKQTNRGKQTSILILLLIYNITTIICLLILSSTIVFQNLVCIHLIVSKPPFELIGTMVGTNPCGHITLADDDTLIGLI